MWLLTTAVGHRLGAAFAVLGGAAMITAAVLVNRALLRRLQPNKRRTIGLWATAVAILPTPFLYFWLAELTVPQMLGKGLLW